MMDPDENLKKQRAIADRICNGENGAAEDWSYLAELVLALDEWIAKGGALPSRWGHKS
jgi:hypothetical protein